MVYYHGTDLSHLEYCAWAGESDEPDMLFASASPEVAGRYGEHLFQIELVRDGSALPRISIAHWVRGLPIPDGSLIVAGEPAEPDFPVDMLVVRNAGDVRIRPFR